MSGGLNTAFTYLIYLLLISFLSYKISYSIAYLLGIIFSFTLNRFFVFDAHKGIRTIVLFPFVYLFQYFLGLFVVWFWVEVLSLDMRFAPIASIILSVPVTFILSRFIFIGRHKE